MESKIVKDDFKPLKKFLSQLEGIGNIKLRVGIMGQNNTKRKYEPGSSSMTNADIGFIHEFGKPATRRSPAIPRRSFLRFPINFKSKRIIKETQQYIDLEKPEKLTAVGIMTQMGAACERAILDAFDSRGFGDWEPNTPYTIRMKAKHSGSTSPLIDLGFLRKSISSEVVS